MTIDLIVFDSASSPPVLEERSVRAFVTVNPPPGEHLVWDPLTMLLVYITSWILFILM